MPLFQFNITVNKHYAPVTQHIGVPAPHHNDESGQSGGNGRKPGGTKVTIVDVIMGGIFATIQSFWNTAMLQWFVGILLALGMPVAWTGITATLIISILVSALPVGFRWLMRKLYC
ncbi:hypothetical protein QE82_13835 [Salmonella enterica subsp. enterica serovar Rubislaw]|uniref:hypothetical protein n=1 Tax=Citrobacter portucalensis TaxID=1639133 RepID=UPI00237C1EED|nr:hypothetical protein [Citrobacter portucalensis]EEA8304784.1 hypothetical protein [Salmonella enterica subsp. enterica serovar Rubislaw]MDQ9159127.1 hypothetical protein [Citrobacter portucalensis]